MRRLMGVSGFLAASVVVSVACNGGGTTNGSGGGSAAGGGTSGAGGGAAGSFTATGSMAIARREATATVLPNGKVLIAGGAGLSATLASAEVYGPSGSGGVGAFTATGSMATARFSATATLLLSGKALIVGGLNNGTALASAEVYDPAGNGGVGSFTATGSLATARGAATATLLPNGKVLIAGGLNGAAMASAEVYDPAGNGGVGSFTATGSLAAARWGATATLLPSGKVLIAGGLNGTAMASAEVYDPAGNGGVGTFTATGSLATARQSATATLLANGKVLIAGGFGLSATLSSAEVYDPAGSGGVGSFTATGSLATAREAATATLLANGRVLIAGGAGIGSSTTLASAELYSP
jgi:Galactose oxidase, central domain